MDGDNLQIRNQNPTVCAAMLHQCWKNFRSMLRKDEPNEFAENVELREVLDSFRQFGSLTVGQYEQAIRMAYEREKKTIHENRAQFPRLEMPQIKEALHVVSAAVRASRPTAPAIEAPKPPPLFGGDPETALDREWEGYWAKYVATKAIVPGGLLYPFWNSDTEPNGMAVLKAIATRIAALPGFSRGDALCKTEDEFIQRFRIAYPSESELLMRYANLLEESERENLKAALTRRFADMSKFPDWEFCKQITLVKYYGELLEQTEAKI